MKAASIRFSELRKGMIITYTLPASAHPTHPDRLWHGLIVRMHAPSRYTLECALVMCMEPGYENDIEIVYPSQVHSIIEISQSGTEPEQLLHDMIQRLQTSSQRKHPLTAHEIEEKQYYEGKISHIPTRQPLTQAEREARERRAQRFSGGKSASEMVIEDRRA